MNLWTRDLQMPRSTKVGGASCMRFQIVGALSGSRLTAGFLR